MRNIVERVKRKSKIFSPGHKPIDFIICGTQKGGTSALDAYLREHPEICMADHKEVHFFDNEDNFSRSKPDYSKYHSHFSPKATHKIVGEATPIYMYWNDAPRRIWEYNPNVKLIVLLRNPIERAYSHWNMERQRNVENLSFWDAIQNEKERCRETLPLQHRLYSYVDRGFYLGQIRRLWAFFPKNRILIIKNEDLKRQPEVTLNDICAFLGVSPFKSVVGKDVHSRSYATNMSERERHYLRSVFEYEIKGLEKVLNWDCSEWLAG